MVKERAKAKFDETIEIAMNLGVDPRHADQMVRGVVTLPNGTGRSVRVGVFARGAKADEARAAGADVVGAEDLVEKVQAGKIDFDRCIATPDMMPLVGRLGKVLGPRGLMPNPKVGTVTMDVTNAVKGAKGGSVEFRVEKAGIVQAGVGKASFAADKLVENIKAFCRRGAQGEAGRRQGHLHQPRGGLLDHGAGREGRACDGGSAVGRAADARTLIIPTPRSRGLPRQRPGIAFSGPLRRAAFTSFKITPGACRAITRRQAARPSSEALQLRPHDGGMHPLRERALGEAAIGAAHHVLAADDFGQPHDPLGHQLRMLDDVGGVADDAGDQLLAGRQLDALPHRPFVLVARIGLLDAVGADLHLQQQIDDVLQRHVEGVRPVPAAPADVIARALLGDAAQRVVERVDAKLRPVAVLRLAHRRHHALVHVGQERVVDLHDEAGIDDGLVFLVQGFGEGEQ